MAIGKTRCRSTRRLPSVTSTAAGCSPVLAKKRWESDGRLPSGRSSSTRSMRCMGKKTTAGVKGSPSRTITARSSNKASSAPLRLRPSQRPERESSPRIFRADCTASQSRRRQPQRARGAEPTSRTGGLRSPFPHQDCRRESGVLQIRSLSAVNSRSTFVGKLRYAGRTCKPTHPFR